MPHNRRKFKSINKCDLTFANYPKSVHNKNNSQLSVELFANLSWYGEESKQRGCYQERIFEWGKAKLNAKLVCKLFLINCQLTHALIISHRIQFHTTVGTRIVEQTPPNFITKEIFGEIFFFVLMTFGCGLIEKFKENFLTLIREVLNIKFDRKFHFHTKL